VITGTPALRVTVKIRLHCAASGTLENAVGGAVYPEPADTMITVTGAPTTLALKIRRQQSGKATVGSTDGATLYSDPGSTTETETGPGCTRDGVKTKAQVDG